MKKPLIICLALLFLASCKKEQPDMTALNAGCDCAEEVTSKFEMLEMTTGNENFADYTDTDSIFGDKNVLFKALTDNAEYTWYIGTEVLNTQEVKRFFPNSMIGQTVPITLVTKKKANTVCFPDDDGYDSVVKYLTIAGDEVIFDTTLIEGIYRVKSPFLSDSVDIKVDLVYDALAPFYDLVVNIYNYNGLDSNCVSLISAYDKNYRQIFLDYNNLTGTAVKENLGGNIHLRLDGVAELNLTTGAKDYLPMPLKEWKYKGRKLK